MDLRLALIADDLTGALDSAAPFAARGARVQVALSVDAVAQALACGPQVLAISTDSREIAPEDAQRRVRQAAQALPPGTRLFKKVDSRLKGNIAAELAGLPFARALIAPAIPAFGRVVQDGRLRGFGVDQPIDVARACGLPPGRAAIPDTTTDADMAAALAASDADLLVGARGLGEALAQALFPGAAQAVRSLPGPGALLVVGSRDPITLAQVAAVRDMRAARIVPAPNGRPATPPGPGRVLLQAVAGATPASPLQVAHALAAAVMDSPPDGTLLLTGGATAAAVLGVLGISHLGLLGECLPGLPVARAGDRIVVAKSGGFGTARTLLEVLDLIDRDRSAA